MKKRNVIGSAAAFVSAEFLLSAYFYRRTMKRSRAKVERTMKMAGTDWSQYADFIEKRKEFFLAQPHEDVWITLDDGLKLPYQVKGIVSDCGFTSPKEVFTHVLHSMYHLPAFPIIPIANIMNRKLAGYGMDECNAAREVKRSTTPTMFIHGSADTFVPSRMCEKMYENCAAKKWKLIVEEAAHAESYYKDTKRYEEALDVMLREVL